MGNEGTPFDDVFRTMLEKCTDLMIPILNETFGTDYKMNEEINLVANEHFFTDEKGKRQKRVTDSYIIIRNHRYHIECESIPNAYIAIRMAEYDFHIALSDMEVVNTADTPGKLKGKVADMEEVDYILRFPQSAVIYLRHNSRTKEKLCVRMIMPDGTNADYNIRTIKVQEYTKKDILDKRLLFFIPFYILRYEKELLQINESKERLRELSRDYESIYEYLKKLEAEKEISESYLYNLIQLTQRLVEVVAKKAGNVKKEVNTMGGKVLELESEKLIEIGMERGIQQVTKSISGVMNKFGLSFEEACNVCDVPPEEYELYRKLVCEAAK